MRFLLVGLSILSLSYEVPVAADRSGSLPFGGSEIELKSPLSPQLADGIRDWLNYMRAKIFRSSQVVPDVGTLIDFTRNSYEQQKKLLEGLTVDMCKDFYFNVLRMLGGNDKNSITSVAAKITFDPEKDWGFRVGRWYVIKKESDDLFSGLWNILHPQLPESTTDAWIEVGFNKEKCNHSPFDSTTRDMELIIVNENPDILNI